jgi:hypothetical protein
MAHRANWKQRYREQEVFLDGYFCQRRFRGTTLLEYGRAPKSPGGT